MKAKTLVAAIFQIALMSQANAYSYYDLTGQSCRSGSNDANVVLSSDGIWNNSTTSAKTVWCPVNRANSASNLQFTGASFATYKPSTIAAITCTIYVRDTVGTYYLSASAGGTGTSGYGSDYWSTASQLPNAGALIYNVVIDAFYCTIPAASPSGYFLRALQVSTLNP